MKPDCYDDYAKVFDLYSNVHLFPQNLRFIDLAADLLAPGDRVTDVGGGTGMFTTALLERVPWVDLTFIEPAPPMMEIAAQRLPLGANLIHAPLDESVLSALPEQRLFLFQRSLYSLYGELEPYHELARQLAARTAPGGHVAIYEMPGPYDLEQAWEYYSLNREVLNITEEVLLGTWPVMEAVFREFNDGVAEGRYTLFDRGSLDALFGGAGFTCSHEEGMTFIYTRG